MIMKAKNFSLNIGEKQIVQQLNLEVKREELLMITGKSGCGKTTLLTNFSLLDCFYQGELFYFDQVVRKSAYQRLKRYHISYMFQNYGLLENSTVQENFALASKYNQELKKERVNELLNEFGLAADIIKEKVYILSGGEQQRIALIRNLLKPFDILFADEPTGNLDKENTEFLMKYLKHLATDEKKAIVVTTHDEQLFPYATARLDLDISSLK